MEKENKPSRIRQWFQNLLGKAAPVDDHEPVGSLKLFMDKVRRYEIRIRKVINQQMQGDFHSVFKGTGLEFDDVRAYQYGDDVRHIDWNVSAKGHGTFVRTFKEEKEQQLFFLLDVSESQQLGQVGQQKIDVAKEICGILAISGVKEASSVGLLCFSDTKERYVKAGKGMKHGYRLLNELTKLRPRSKNTDINAALRLTLSMLKRKCIIVIISDFLDDGYERSLKAMAQKHDLICIHLLDPSETEMPNIGIAPVQFKESGEQVYLNTSAGNARSRMADYYAKKSEAMQEICAKHQANYLDINTQIDFVPQLVRLFKVRNLSKKR